MAKCPKCKEEIEDLNYYSKVEVTQTFDLDGDSPNYGPHYSAMDNYGDHSDEEYRCPECDALLTDKEEEAIEILKGK